MYILSIDAWGNEQDGYEWNAWYRVSTISKVEFERIEKEEGFIQWFINKGYVKNFPDKLEICDDGYDIVIQDKETGEPLFAIEYGCEY